MPVYYFGKFKRCSHCYQTPNTLFFAKQIDKYAYQGHEKKIETGMEAFQLRLWDSRIGRWLTADPEAEFHSPPVVMGNNPIRKIDPDGVS
ncbi:hypothetical protein TPENAI_60753 [Tenacibaculum litopenaei]